MAQLDDVHSVLSLNYETQKDLILLAPPSVAKPTDYETLRERFASSNVRCSSIDTLLQCHGGKKRFEGGFASSSVIVQSEEKLKMVVNHRNAHRLYMV